MNEWPKFFWDAPRLGAKVHEVIPADLGRELYDALQLFPASYVGGQVRAALRRYEREVGRDD